MSENPLLPHRQLRELHALMLRSRALQRKSPTRDVAREALLAATLIHLQPGDLLSAPGEDPVVHALAPEGKHHRPQGTLIRESRLEARLQSCAAAARGLQAAGADGVLLAYARAGTQEPGWAAALQWAQESQLPLLLACSDATNGSSASRKKAAQPPIDFSTMTRLARRLKLPVLTVDGEDAVAVYRVMQESVLRARQGGGPSVLWAVLTPPRGLAAMPASCQPIARLRSYLKIRKIALND